MSKDTSKADPKKDADKGKDAAADKKEEDKEEKKPVPLTARQQANKGTSPRDPILLPRRLECYCLCYNVLLSLPSSLPYPPHPCLSRPTDIRDACELLQRSADTQDFRLVARALQKTNSVRRRLSLALLTPVLTDIAPSLLPKLTALAAEYKRGPIEEDEEREEKEEAERKEQEAKAAAERAAALAAAAKEAASKPTAGKPVAGKPVAAAPAAPAPSSSSSSSSSAALSDEPGAGAGASSDAAKQSASPASSPRALRKADRGRPRSTRTCSCC